MRYLAALIVGLCMVASAQAQLPPGLGGADPSQQLKTVGPPTAIERYLATPTQRPEPREPLVSRVEERDEPIHLEFEPDRPHRTVRHRVHRARRRSKSRRAAQARQAR